MYRNRLNSLYQVTFENIYKFRREPIARTTLTGISGYREFSSEYSVALRRQLENDVHQASLTFNNGYLAMKSNSFGDIVRAVIILKLCKYNVFVDNSEKLVKWSKKVFGRQFYEKVLKATFYKQFVAGEGERDVTDTAANLKKFNINCMFCVPTEDISNDVLLDDSTIKEDEYETNLKLMLSSVDLTASCGIFAQSKITPIISVNVMHDVSKLLSNHLSSHNMRPPLSVETWAEAFDGQNDQLVPELSSKAFDSHIKQAMKRLDTLAKRAQQKGVKLMLDAEHTFIQASIDTIILALQKKFNLEDAVVYNTYQCYRKDTLARIQSDIELAQKHGFKIACKLVRGAYMDFERQRAAELGYPNPICNSYEETGENYKKAMDLMLSMVAQGQGEVMFATHNEDCILYGIRRMNELEIKPDAGSVCFGQLYGMCDHITYELGNAGYLVHKSVPYGTLDRSILYLIRRAQENKSVMARTAKETEIILGEVKRRIKNTLTMA